MHIRSITGTLLLALAATAALADMPKQDTAKGGKDHPLLSRFAGAKLVGYAAKEYDAASLVAGKVPDDARRVPDKELALEGRHTVLIYNFPPERSGLEVMRNHEAALQAAGFTTVFSCAAAACGKDFGEMMLQRIDAHTIEGSTAYWEPFNYGRDAERYLLARGTRPDGSVVHAAIYVVDPVSKHNGGVLLDIVEARAMDTGKVSATLNAEAMAKNIATEGKVAIYGVYFDTDKADVKPQSKAALDEMAKLLKSQPGLKVYIVGHTDAQGALAHNMELSQRRAEAVAKALETSYKIDGRRLSAKGVASLAPVASNDAEPGREKNRRVELVKQ
jgi:outer membrane protein OmpA-like peptidoglycan-associated protein